MAYKGPVRPRDGGTSKKKKEEGWGEPGAAHAAYIKKLKRTAKPGGKPSPTKRAKSPKQKSDPYWRVKKGTAKGRAAAQKKYPVINTPYKVVDEEAGTTKWYVRDNLSRHGRREVPAPKKTKRRAVEKLPLKKVKNEGWGDPVKESARKGEPQFRVKGKGDKPDIKLKGSEAKQKAAFEPDKDKKAKAVLAKMKKRKDTKAKKKPAKKVARLYEEE